MRNSFYLYIPANYIQKKIEVDIPLIDYYPLTEQADKGINPDIEIPVTIMDILSNKDKVIEKHLN